MSTRMVTSSNSLTFYGWRKTVSSRDQHLHVQMLHKSESKQNNTNAGANSNIHIPNGTSFCQIGFTVRCSHGTRVFPCFTSRKMDWVFHHRINQDLECTSLLPGSICLVKCKQNLTTRIQVLSFCPLWIHFTLIRHQAHFHWNVMKHILPHEIVLQFFGILTSPKWRPSCIRTSPPYLAIRFFGGADGGVAP